MTWITLGIVLGGRLGYCLFYQPAYYLQNPLEIAMVWQGGMSFHGGMIATGLAVIGYAMRHGIPIRSILDVAALATPLGLGLGRVANFVNGELWGRPSEAPWAVIFPGNAAQQCENVVVEGIALCARHPSQLYEAALEGLLLLVVLWWVAFRGGLAVRGLICGLFLAGYGAARIFVEYFRQADAQYVTADSPWGHVIGWGEVGLTMGQVLSLPMLVAGAGAAWLAVRAYRRAVPAPPRGVSAALRDHLLARIRAAGLLTVADWMADCLLHPVHGYYVTRDPLGRAGDFTTAPEISQTFGEMLGLCLAQVWLEQRLGPVTLAELGPGRGTLMADVLRATRACQGSATRSRCIWSRRRRSCARGRRRRWRGSPPRSGTTAWTRCPTARSAPGQRVPRRAPDPPARPRGGRLARAAGDGAGRRACLRARARGRRARARRPAGRDRGHDGRALPRPARHRRRGGGARRARRRGDRRRLRPLARARGHAAGGARPRPHRSARRSLGRVDLTAHVDFEAVASAAAPARASGMVTQGVLLERLGIVARARALAARLDGPALDAHVAAHRRLTHPAEMGGTSTHQLQHSMFR